MGGKEFFNQLQIICFNLVLNRYFISICLNHDSCQINCQLGYETVNNLGLLTHNNISSVCVRRSSIFSMIVFLADPTLLFVETPCFTAAQFICLIQSQTKCSTLLYPSHCWNDQDKEPMKDTKIKCIVKRELFSWLNCASLDDKL